MFTGKCFDLLHCWAACVFILTFVGHSDVCGQNVLTFLDVKFYCHCWRLWAKCFDLSGCEIILSLLTFVGKTFWPFWLWYFTVTADGCGQNVLTFLAVEFYCHCWRLWAKRFDLSGCEMLPSLLTFMGHTCYLLTRLHISVMLTFMGRPFWRFIYKDYCHFEVYRPSVRPFRLLDITVEVTFIGKPFEPFMTFSAILLTIKTMIHVRSSSSDCMMHDQLLWKPQTLMKLFSVWSCNVGFKLALVTNGDVTAFVLSSWLPRVIITMIDNSYEALFSHTS